MSNTAIDHTWTTVRTSAAAGLVAVCLAASAAADAPSLAAPGDCAQPSRDFDTGPLPPSVSSGGVSGPPALGFAPIATTQDVVARLPLDLTGITLQVVPTVNNASTTLLGTIGQTLGLVDSSATGVGHTTGEAVGAIGDVVGNTVGNVAGSAAGNTVDGAVGSVGGTAAETVNTAADVANTALGGATSTANDLANTTNDASATFLDSATGTGTTLVQDANTLIQGTTNTVTGATGGLPR